MIINKQVMASGMTTSTAKVKRSCDTIFLDEAGLRTHPECDLVLDPNFGLLEVLMCWYNNNTGIVHQSFLLVPQTAASCTYVCICT